jgi:hypothetical protein
VSAPRFWSSFGQALQISAQSRGFMAFVPWWLLICIFAPAAVAWIANGFCLPKLEPSQIVTILAAFAVISGFLGSVTVAALTHIQSVASKYPFSDYLKAENLFDQFLFWPQFVLLIQIVHILFSTASAVVVLFIGSQVVLLMIVAINIGFTFYVVSKTWQLVEMIRQLMWHSADYEKLYQENRNGK